MKSLSLLSAVAALPPSASASPPAEQGGTYLLSITGIQIDENEYVDRFTLATWGVHFLSVCHLPPGWSITAGKSAAPDGAIEGEASHGVTFLDRHRLSELHGLALVRLYEGVRRSDIRATADGHMPATFAGDAGIGTYGRDDGPRRQVRLTYANLRLTPAAACPAPSG